MSVRVPILYNHRVHPDDDCPPTPPVGEYCGHVSTSHFRRQMEYLAETGCKTITYRELSRWLLDGTSIPDRAVLIDFDDGRLNVYQNAVPIMREFGFVGTVFVVSQLADGADLGAMSRNYPAMSWKELGTLAREGWAMAAHTRTHPMLAQLFNEPGGASKCAIEITGVRQEIEAHLGEAPDWFAYPGPSWNEELEEIVKQTYHTARWWSLPGDPPHYVTRESNPYRLPANDICAHRSFDDFCRIIDGMF
jgi:peptidoglycan/xylan/chitin deacetylase (PgdA/CDA1 family)